MIASGYQKCQISCSEPKFDRVIRGHFAARRRGRADGRVPTATSVCVMVTV